jgi:hypothetical protein
MTPSQTAFRSEVVDVTSTVWAFSGTATQRPIAIHCNAASTIVGALMRDATETTWILPAGVTPYAFKSINTTSTTKSGMRILYGA